MNTRAQNILDAFTAIGVENWSGYDDAMELVNDNLEDGDDPSDPEIILGALESTGVESWSGYEDAMTLLHGDEENVLDEDTELDFYDDDLDDDDLDDDDLDDDDLIDDDDQDDDDTEDIDDLEGTLKDLGLED